MGSERKSKRRDEEKENDKRKKRRNSPYDSEDERKSSKKGKRKDKKSHKRSKHHSDKEKKSDEKQKSKRHKHDRHPKLEFQELSKDDYFSKNNEFAKWLKEKRKVFFNELTSESARELFVHFVKDWNDRRLDSEYYEGIASGPRTAHNWNIKK